MKDLQPDLADLDDTVILDQDVCRGRGLCLEHDEKILGLADQKGCILLMDDNLGARFSLPSPRYP